MTDAQLLSQFVSERSASAFESLMKRHGPMVMGVCRRILRDEADAEDAFQTTFLVLVRKAATVRPRSMIGNWLYGVAHTTALKARAMRIKRSAKERQVATTGNVEQPSQQDFSQLQGLLDGELRLLPARYRSVIVMCELEGRSTKEAARELGCPLGTVTSRLVRGRRLLADRLTRRGLTLSGGLLALGLSQSATAAVVSPQLMTSTLQSAICLATPGMGTGMLETTITTLTREVLKAMFLSKLKVLGVIMSLAVVVTVSLGGLLSQIAAAAEKTELQGAWQAVEGEVLGNKLKKEDREIKDMQFVFQGSELVIGPPAGTGKTGPRGEKAGQRKKTFVLAPDKTPKEIDMTSLDGQEKGETSRGIYKLEKDRLTVCLLVKAQTERPKEFKAGASDGMMIFVLDRVK